MTLISAPETDAELLLRCTNTTCDAIRVACDLARADGHYWITHDYLLAGIVEVMRADQRETLRMADLARGPHSDRNSFPARSPANPGRPTGTDINQWQEQQHPELQQQKARH